MEKWSDDSAETKKNKELIEKAFAKLYGSDKMNNSMKPINYGIYY